MRRRSKSAPAHTDEQLITLLNQIDTDAARVYPSSPRARARYTRQRLDENGTDVVAVYTALRRCRTKDAAT